MDPTFSESLGGVGEPPPSSSRKTSRRDPSGGGRARDGEGDFDGASVSALIARMIKVATATTYLTLEDTHVHAWYVVMLLLGIVILNSLCGCKEGYLIETRDDAEPNNLLKKIYEFGTRFFVEVSRSVQPEPCDATASDFLVAYMFSCWYCGSCFWLMFVCLCILLYILVSCRI